MIQMQTILDVADNSGARKIMAIRTISPASLMRKSETSYALWSKTTTPRLVKNDNGSCRCGTHCQKHPRADGHLSDYGGGNQ